ncbi:glycosyltransferase family 4 protein [Klenkia sp. PcliD-1-E]|uniref:glycosyltransferase family 4 protein n=1 Tax=Klenkia sp. PcliD-1-E TaxID=2954492 RepID=UPI002096CC62|nr:glycosyltransferase family 4 protein [Klenkia sp. PcliD-1-E]MCO7219996.1 glycosyltransferase family 4 protein [Klenkia sp. PcliD-1-E]
MTIPPQGGERILVVSPYPPVRDGIATYALQTVRALRAQGHDVEVLSPGPSAAHHHLDLVGPRGALALAKRVGDYDRVVVQFHPDFFYPDPGRAKSRLTESLALAVPFALAKRLEVVVHEIDGRHGNPRRPDGLAARRLWALVDDVKVHTASERTAFIENFGVDPDRVSLVAHGADFTAHTTVDRARARESLGLPEDETVFLAIGFVQPSKGFDRAVEAFDGLGGDGASLHVVGSVRVDDPDMVSYERELADLCSMTEGAYLHSGYVSDELFDRWIVASDVVVLPYRNIWSSGVLERAGLFGRPVIASRVGGLSEQAAQQADVRLVDDDAELREAMIERLPERELPADTGWADDLPADGDLHDLVQARVRARASTRPGSGRGRRARPTTTGEVRTVSASAPVRRLGRLGPPDVNHPRRPVRLVKRVLRRALSWQIDPLVHQINSLQSATVVALENRPADGVGGPGDERGARTGA